MRVAVVGAGITGLAAASFLRRRGHEVVLLEAAPRAGGLIRSRVRDGFVLEDGPASIRGGSLPVRALLDAHGLVERVLPAATTATARFVLDRGRLVRVPGSITGLLGTPILSWRGRLRIFGEPFVGRPPIRDPRETLYSFVARRVGAEVADGLLDAVVAGITGGDARTLDAAGLLARMVDGEERHGSLFAASLRGPRRTEPRGPFSFARGIGELVDVLVADAGDGLRLGRRVERVEKTPAGLTVWSGGEPIAVERVVLTCDPATLATLVEDVHLPALPRAPLAAVSLGYPASALPGGLPGFGWLAPARERTDVLGCLWISGVFPSHAPAGHHLLRVMVGGTRRPDLLDVDDAALVDHARRLLREVQGLDAEPVLTDVVRAVPGIPQPPPGWKRAVTSLALPPGITLAGWWYTGIGVADAIEAAALLS